MYKDTSLIVLVIFSRVLLLLNFVVVFVLLLLLLLICFCVSFHSYVYSSIVNNAELIFFETGFLQPRFLDTHEKKKCTSRCNDQPLSDENVRVP